MDQLDGDICAYIRGRKDKAAAITMAAAIYGKSRRYIVRTLQDCGLLDEQETYREPVRLTGKEVTMERKIDYPAWRWSSKKKERLSRLYQEGKTVEEIAAIFEIDTDTVMQAIAKQNLCRTVKVPVEAGSGTWQPAAPEEQPPASAPQTQIRAALEEIRQTVEYAGNLQRDMVNHLLGDHRCEAFYLLGKQAVLLEGLDESITSLLQTLEP